MNHHNRGFRTSLLLILVALLACSPDVTTAQKKAYLAEIIKSEQKAWDGYPALRQAWKQSTNQSTVLWGYNAPGSPLYAAAIDAFLYQVTGERRYCDRAVFLLREYGTFRDNLPQGFASTRPEYANGIPPLTNFFFLPPFARAYYQLAGTGLVPDDAKAVIERDLAASADFVFSFPEWGAHNRAMLRAEGLLYASLALPRHPHATRWRALADAIAADNLAAWEIEDATGYHGIWLTSVLSFAEAAGRQDVVNSPFFRYYYEYYLRLIGPNGMIPDFGDAAYESSVESLRFLPFFERGAAQLHQPELRWAAQTLFAYPKRTQDTLTITAAYFLCDAWRWTDETIEARRPAGGSQEVLDDIVGKKIVLRNGWDSTSTYLLVNYRDEGDGGYMGREYLRTTISVEEEKMHHGHADENSIALLMDKGSILLHDAGYRSALPSGPYGAWRQDYFHNRVVVRKNKRDPLQPVMSFVQNSGAYRQVRTQKIDFVRLRHADISRTRVTDENLGYQWDRIITYLPDPGMFLVVDDLKALRADYFTFTDFWHTSVLLDRKPHAAELATDTLWGRALSHAQALHVQFLDTLAKTEGDEPVFRNGRTERALYQTISSQYAAGDHEVFVTALIPHPRGGAALPAVRLLPVSKPYKAAAIEVKQGGVTTTVCLKLDLGDEIARANIRPRYLYELGATVYGSFETDAHMMVTREAAGHVDISAVNVLQVRSGGKTLMEALPNLHGLQLDGAPDRVGYTKWRLREETFPARATGTGAR